MGHPPTMYTCKNVNWSSYSYIMSPTRRTSRLYWLKIQRKIGREPTMIWHNNNKIYVVITSVM